jgi:hypothetical protein
LAAASRPSRASRPTKLSAKPGSENPIDSAQTRPTKSRGQTPSSSIDWCDRMNCAR